MENNNVPVLNSSNWEIITKLDSEKRIRGFVLTKFPNCTEDKKDSFISVDTVNILHAILEFKCKDIIKHDRFKRMNGITNDGSYKVIVGKINKKEGSSSFCDDFENQTSITIVDVRTEGKTIILNDSLSNLYSVFTLLHTEIVNQSSTPNQDKQAKKEYYIAIDPFNFDRI